MRILTALVSLIPVVIPVILAGCGGIVDTRTEHESFTSSRSLENFEELEVDLDFGVGNVEFGRSPDPGELYSIELDYDRLHYEPILDFESSGRRARLRFQLDSSGGIPFGDNDNDLVMHVSGGVPLDLELGTGVGESYVDLTGLAVRNLRFRGGVGTSELTFDAPQAEPASVIAIDSGVGEVIVRGLGNTRVREFRFEAGVGESELDFTGEWGEGTTEADIDVGVGELRLVIPEDLAVEIEVADSFLSDVSASAFERQGGRYVRNVTRDRVARLLIRIDSGLGEIRLEVR
jgi:hypothetical protein